MANNDLRITGLATGIDTQSYIDKILKYRKASINKLTQQQTKILWQQDAYRELNTALSSLRDLVFELRMQTTYNIRKVNSSNTQVATATAAANSPTATYMLQVDQLATSATNSSGNAVFIRAAVLGDFLNPTDENPIVIDSTNNTFTVTLDPGTADVRTENITLTAGSYTAANLNTLAADIQSRLDEKFGTGKIFVKITADHELQFATAQNDDGGAHTFILKNYTDTDGVDTTLTSLGFNDQANTKELVGGILSAPITVDSSNNTFKIALGNGITQTVTLDPAGSPYSLDDFAAEIQSKIRALGGDYANVQVDVSNYDQLRITAVDGSGNPLPIKLFAGSSADILKEMGFTDGTISESTTPIDTSLSILNLKDRFINSTFFIDPDHQEENSTFSFAINGQSFTFNMSDSLNKIINTVNSNSQAGVAMSYDSFTNKITLTATKSGASTTGTSILINDPDNFLSQVFSITQAGEKPGQNAKLTVNGVETQKTENTFTMNGVTFTLTGAGLTSVSVSTDTSAIIEKVQKFIDSYNQIVTNMYGKITEERPTYNNDKYTFYEPLTDDQKKDMSDDEIENWTTQAKKGLLHNDQLLSEALFEMQMSLGRVVESPRTLTGAALSGTVDLSGANRFKVTLGSQTREIILDERTYDSGNYTALADELQNKLNMAFGTNKIQVKLNSINQISLTTKNIALSLNKPVEGGNALTRLGFSDGVSVSATYAQLYQIGITTGSYLEGNVDQTAKLSFDKDKFAAALIKDPEGVMRLLTNFEDIPVADSASSFEKAQAAATENARKGIFSGFYETLNGSTILEDSDEENDNNSYNGLIRKFNMKAGVAGSAVSNRYELGQELLELNERLSVAQERYNEEETRLYRLFTAMETTINNYNAQAAWLTSFLGGGAGNSGS